MRICIFFIFNTKIYLFLDCHFTHFIKKLICYWFFEKNTLPKCTHGAAITTRIGACQSPWRWTQREQEIYRQKQKDYVGSPSLARTLCESDLPLRLLFTTAFVLRGFFRGFGAYHNLRTFNRSQERMTRIQRIVITSHKSLQDLRVLFLFYLRLTPSSVRLRFLQLLQPRQHSQSTSNQHFSKTKYFQN